MDTKKGFGTVKRKKKANRNIFKKQMKCENEFDTSIDYRKKLVSFYISKNFSKSNKNMFDKKRDLFANDYCKRMNEKSSNLPKIHGTSVNKKIKEKLFYFSKNPQTHAFSTNGFNSFEISEKKINQINDVTKNFSKEFPSITKQSEVNMNDHHSFIQNLVSDTKIYDPKLITSSNQIKIVKNKVPIVTIKKLSSETCNHYLNQYQKSNVKTSHPSKKFSSIKNIHNKNLVNDVLVSHKKTIFRKAPPKFDQVEALKDSLKKNQANSKIFDSSLTTDKVKHVDHKVINEFNKETYDNFKRHVSSNNKEVFSKKDTMSKDSKFIKKFKNIIDLNSETNLNNSSSKIDISNSENINNKSLIIKIKKSNFRSSFDCLKMKFEEIMKDSNIENCIHSEYLEDGNRINIKNVIENTNSNTESNMKKNFNNSSKESKTDSVNGDEINYPVHKNDKIFVNASTFNAKLSKLFVKKSLMISKNDNTNEAISSSENLTTISLNMTTTTNAMTITTPMYNTLPTTMNLQHSLETASIVCISNLSSSFVTKFIDTSNVTSSLITTYTDTPTVVNTALSNRESITNTGSKPSLKTCIKKSSFMNKKSIKSKNINHEKVKSNVDPKSRFIDYSKKYSSVKFQKKTKCRNKNLANVNKENKTPDIIISKSSENPLDQHSQLYNECEEVNNIENKCNIKKPIVDGLDSDILYLKNKLPQCIELKHNGLSSTTTTNLKSNIEACELHSKGVPNKDLEPTYLEDVLNGTHSRKVDNIIMKNKSHRCKETKKEFHKRRNSAINKYSLKNKSLNNIDIESIKKMLISKIENHAKILDSKNLNVSHTANNLNLRLNAKNDNLFESISSLKNINTDYEKQNNFLDFQSSNNSHPTGSKNIVISNNNGLLNHSLEHNKQLTIRSNRTPNMLTHITHQRHPFEHQSWSQRFFLQNNQAKESYTLFRRSLNSRTQSQNFLPHITTFPHSSQTNTHSFVTTGSNHNQRFQGRKSYSYQKGDFEGHQQKSNDPHININFNFHYYDQKQVHNHYYDYQNDQPKCYNPYQQPIKLKLCFPKNTQNQQVVPPNDSNVKDKQLRKFDAKITKHKKLNFNNFKLFQDESFFKKLNTCISKLNKQGVKADCGGNLNAIGSSQSLSKISSALKTSENQYKILKDSRQYTVERQKNRLKKYTKIRMMGNIETIKQILVKYKRGNYTFLKRTTKMELSKTIKAKYAKQRISFIKSLTLLTRSRSKNCKINKINKNDCSNESHKYENTWCFDEPSISSPHNNTKERGYSKNSLLLNLEKKHTKNTFKSTTTATISTTVSLEKASYQDNFSSNQHETCLTEFQSTNKTSTTKEIVEPTNNLTNKKNEDNYVDTGANVDNHAETQSKIDGKVENESFEENDDDADDNSDNDVNDTTDDELEDVLSQKIDNEILRRCSINGNTQFSTLKCDFVNSSPLRKLSGYNDNYSVDNCSSYSSENEVFLEKGESNADIVGSVNNCFNQYENGFSSAPITTELPTEKKAISQNFTHNKVIVERDDLVFSSSNVEGNVNKNNLSHIENYSGISQSTEQNQDNNSDNSSFENTKAFLSKLFDEDDKSNCSFIQKCKYSEESDFEDNCINYLQTNNEKEDVRKEKNTENYGCVARFGEKLQDFPCLTLDQTDEQSIDKDALDDGYLETLTFGIDYSEDNDDNINETLNINSKYFENSKTNMVSCEKVTSVISQENDRKESAENNVLNEKNVGDQVSDFLNLNKFEQAAPSHINIEANFDCVVSEKNKKNNQYENDVQNLENKNENSSSNNEKLNYSTDDIESINDKIFNINTFVNNIDIEKKNKIQKNDDGVSTEAGYCVYSPKRGKVAEMNNIAKNDVCLSSLQIKNNFEEKYNEEIEENVGSISSDLILNENQQTDNTNFKDSSVLLHGFSDQLGDVEVLGEHEKINCSLYVDYEKIEYIDDTMKDDNNSCANNSNNKTNNLSKKSHYSEKTNESADKNNHIQSIDNNSTENVSTQYEVDSDKFEKNSKLENNLIYGVNKETEYKDFINNNQNIGLAVNTYDAKSSIGANLNINETRSRSINKNLVLNNSLNIMQNVSIDKEKDKCDSLNNFTKSITTSNNVALNLNTKKDKVFKVDEKNNEDKNMGNEEILLTSLTSNTISVENTNSNSSDNLNEIEFSNNLNSEELIKSFLYQIIDKIVDDLHCIRGKDLKADDKMCRNLNETVDNITFDIDKDKVVKNGEISNEKFDGLYEDYVVAVEDYSSNLSKYANNFVTNELINKNGKYDNNSLKKYKKINQNTKGEHSICSIENIEMSVNKDDFNFKNSRSNCENDKGNNYGKLNGSNKKTNDFDETELEELTKEKIIGTPETKSTHKRIAKRITITFNRKVFEKKRRKTLKSIDKNGSKDHIAKLRAAGNIAKLYLTHFKRRVGQFGSEKLSKSGTIKKSSEANKKLKKTYNGLSKTFVSDKNITVNLCHDNNKLKKNISLDEDNFCQKTFFLNDLPEGSLCEMKVNILQSAKIRENNEDKKNEKDAMKKESKANDYETINYKNVNVQGENDDGNPAVSLSTNNFIEDDNDSQARQEIDMAVESILSEDYFSKFHENTEYQPLDYTLEVLTETNDLAVDDTQNTNEYNICDKEVSINIVEDSAKFCETKIDSIEDTNISSVKNKSPRNKNIISNNNAGGKSNLKFLKSFKSKWFMLHKKGKGDSSFSPEKQHSPVKINGGDSTAKKLETKIENIDETVKKFQFSEAKSFLLQNTSLGSKFYRVKFINRNLKKFRKRIFILKKRSTNTIVYVNKLAQAFEKSIFFKSKIRHNFDNENCLIKIFSRPLPLVTTTFFVFQPIRTSIIQSCLSVRDQNLSKLSTYSTNQHQKLPKINKQSSLNVDACSDNEIINVSLKKLDKHNEEIIMGHQKSKPSCEDSAQTNFSPDISCIISAAIKSSLDSADFYPKEENLLNQPHQNQLQSVELYRQDNSNQKHIRENNYPLYHYPANNDEFPCRFEIYAPSNKESFNKKIFHELLNTQQPSYQSIDSLKYNENTLQPSQLPSASKSFSFDNSLLLPHSLNQNSYKRKFSKANCINLNGHGFDNQINRDNIHTSHNYDKASGGPCFVAKNFESMPQSNNLSSNNDILPPWNPYETMNFYKNSSHNLCLNPSNMYSSSNHIIKPTAIYEPTPVKPVFRPPPAANSQLLDSLYRHYPIDQNQSTRFTFPPNLLRPMSRPYYQNLDPKNISYQNNHLINVKNLKNCLYNSIPLDQNRVSLIDFSQTRLHHPNIGNKNIYSRDYSHFPLTNTPHDSFSQNNASNGRLKSLHNQTLQRSSTQYGEQSELEKLIDNTQIFSKQNEKTSLAPTKGYYSKKKRMLTSFYNNEALLNDKFNYQLNNLILEGAQNKNHYSNANIHNVPRPTSLQYDKVHANFQNSFFRGNPGNSSQKLYRPSCIETHYK